jgi:RNA dependent RNA polymerase
MEIFIRNLPFQATKDELQHHLEPALKAHSVSQFHLEILRNRGCAKLTILDRGKGDKFLADYGEGPGGSSARRPIFLARRQIRCIKSRYEPAAHIMRALSLRLEATSNTGIGSPAAHERPTRTYKCSMIHCGVWDYVEQDLAFISHFRHEIEWTATFGSRSCVIASNSAMRRPQLVIPYSSIYSLTVGSNHHSSFTLSLTEAPRMSALITDDPFAPQDFSLDSLLQSLLDFNPRTRGNIPSRKRISGLDAEHETVASGCLVYRLVLKNPADSEFTQALQKARGLPPSISHETVVVNAQKDFSNEMLDLCRELALAFASLPFQIRFQLQKLAQNGFLRPRRVQELLPTALQLVRRSGVKIAAQTFQRLEHHIGAPGPETTADELTLESLSQVVMGLEQNVEWDSAYLGDMQGESEQSALIHKAMVTPTGVHLDGPHLETKNRVLRKYSAHTNHFLRVIFCDEDWEPCRFDREASLEEIFHQRFLKVLDSDIYIAGLRFEFLGFSHSSLRARSCWFMAPFVENGRLLPASEVIQGLGDFSEFRSPAKCAARIGQAFSDTVSSICIPPNSVKEIEDVVRNDSTFSDGVGTVSPSILRTIWDKHGSSRHPKPTLFQIRYAGAKGMISLDNRLEGDLMCLRPSMIKFQGSSDNKLEICQGAKLIPLYLNQQYIKILEDLGVRGEIFLKMQKQDVDRLRKAASSPTDAADFLERDSIGRAAKLPYLLRKLQFLGLSFQADEFLNNAVELRMLIRLREIKYRSRLSVEKGCLLYGIMDETNYLQEGQVFCTFQTNDIRKTILTGRVVVTRPPALHPGDIRTVEAVKVPQDSPLNELGNCIVFSQQGERSLPSMLSGGDLDGDTYAVIYDAHLCPEFLVPPAEYLPAHPININRQVERKDMTRFLIQFMENDQLGRIALLHRSLADKSLMGTFDPDCVRLAEMHSTAVDFSKTGIQVRGVEIGLNASN